MESLLQVLPETCAVSLCYACVFVSAPCLLDLTSLDELQDFTFLEW